MGPICVNKDLFRLHYDLFIMDWDLFINKHLLNDCIWKLIYNTPRSINIAPILIYATLEPIYKQAYLLNDCIVDNVIDNK